MGTMTRTNTMPNPTPTTPGDAFHAAGGDPEAMAAANNTTVAKMLSSKGKARDINVELVKTETDMLLLKGKTAVPKDGKLFDETTGVTK